MEMKKERIISEVKVWVTEDGEYLTIQATYNEENEEYKMTVFAGEKKQPSLTFEFGQLEHLIETRTRMEINSDSVLELLKG